MHEARIDLLLGRGHAHPELQAVQRLAVAAVIGGGPLGMHDAAPGGHPVDRARMDRGFYAEIVAVDDFAVIEVGQGGQPDMRMRPHVEPVAALELGRAEMIEKDERPDRPPAAVRQRAAHRKAIQINAARHHHGFERIAGITVARGRILARKKTHADLDFQRWNCGCAFLECREQGTACQMPRPGKRDLQIGNAKARPFVS